MKSVRLFEKKISKITSIPKRLLYARASSQHVIPPILLNSFPKSGTHLLDQILSSLPEVQDFGRFIASMPSISQKQRGVQKTLSLLEKQLPGELIRAHIFYHPQLDEYLNTRQSICFFIYRDPRDVAISEANYLYDMNKFHKLHFYYKRFDSINDRIKFAILGNQFYQTSVFYPDIRERFSLYKPWIDSPIVFSVRYEDLTGSDKNTWVHNIVKHFSDKTGIAFTDDLVESALLAINPEKSHTFRQGGREKWKTYFTDEHKEMFKEIAGDLLIELGYETHRNW